MTSISINGFAQGSAISCSIIICVLIRDYIHAHHMVRGTFSPMPGCFQSSVFTYPLPEEICRRISAAATSANLVLGVRPEDIQILNQQADAAIPAEVYVVEPMGNEALVAFQVRDVRLTVRAAPDFTAPAGTVRWLSFNLQRLHIFDQDSGNRLNV